LIKCENELNKDVTVEYLLTNKVVIHLNVLCVSIKHWVGSQGQGTNIVTLEDRRCRKKNLEFFEQHLKPKQFSYSNRQRPILYLYAGVNDNYLLLSTLSNEAIAKKNSKLRSGTTIIRATYPIRVTEGIQLKITLGEVQAISSRPIEISEDTFDYNPMSSCGSMHLLTQLID
jgi:hypothetical protein